MLASRQHVYGRDLRFGWFGIYHGILSEIAFHEKAGRSQVVPLFFSWDKVFSRAESPPLSLPFHPHSLMSDPAAWHPPEYFLHGLRSRAQLLFQDHGTCFV